MRFVQLLPVNEMQEGQSSPYSALSAMALDPIFIAIDDLPEAAGAAIPRDEQADIDRARSAHSVLYPAVRAAKRSALERAFAVFEQVELSAGGPRSRAFRDFCEREAWWLDDYVLFRALHEHHHGRHWQEWDQSLRSRQLAAMADARTRFARPILYYSWLQWVADDQWQRVRTQSPVAILGDFPFMVSGHSADVWARQEEFAIDVSVGVPPDAFSETGQDWGLPLYRWDVIARGGDEWLRMRARRCAELYDGFRIDHLVGFYRTFYRTADGGQYFDPADEPAQQAQGERLMRIFAEPGVQLIAEDLGQVPDFVRASIAALGVPGLKVCRWEREWDAEGKPFRDPARYPPVSVAITGTHDTESLAEWWDNADAAERRAVLALPLLREAAPDADAPYSAALRDALLRAVYGAASNLVIMPLQDVFGWRDRINTPALVSDDNWSWRLPWPVEDLLTEPEAVERAQFLRRLAEETGRT
jgi:4-alpha-glucanotransferase